MGMLQIRRIFKAQVLMARQKNVSIRKYSIQNLSLRLRLFINIHQARHMIWFVQIICVQVTNDICTFVQGVDAPTLLGVLP